MIPVGSSAVRESIEKHRPMPGLHGHIHESSGIYRWVGLYASTPVGSTCNESIVGFNERRDPTTFWFHVERKMGDNLKADQIGKTRNQESPQQNIIEEAQRILARAKSRRLVLRLLGGVGIFFSSQSARRPEYLRNYNDLDFMSLRKQRKQVENLFEDLGYAPREMFNKLQGDKRLIFTDETNKRRIDIFLNEFEMCHRFDFKDRLELTEMALTPADLLLTKLQVVEIDKKDIMDAIVLILDNPLSDDKKRNTGVIDKERIVSLASENWGIYKTLTLNIDKILSLKSDLPVTQEDWKIVSERLSKLKKAIEESPKSFSWKVRARVGDRVRWYELPESP